jgi:hypothetical protein
MSEANRGVGSPTALPVAREIASVASMSEAIPAEWGGGLPRGEP